MAYSKKNYSEKTCNQWDNYWPKSMPDQKRTENTINKWGHWQVSKNRRKSVYQNHAWIVLRNGNTNHRYISMEIHVPGFRELKINKTTKNQHTFIRTFINYAKNCLLQRKNQPLLLNQLLWVWPFDLNSSHQLIRTFTMRIVTLNSVITNKNTYQHTIQIRRTTYTNTAYVQIRHE